MTVVTRSRSSTGWIVLYALYAPLCVLYAFIRCSQRNSDRAQIHATGTLSLPHFYGKRFLGDCLQREAQLIGAPATGVPSRRGSEKNSGAASFCTHHSCFVLGQITHEVPAMFLLVGKRRDAKVLCHVVDPVAQSDQFVVLSDR